MGERTFTPGPWTAQLHFAKDYAGRSHAFITNGSIVPLAAVVLGVEGCSQDEGRANARLIAAAPDLLTALELILPLAIGYSPPGQSNTARATCNSWIEAARDAVAKALTPTTEEQEKP